MQSRGILVYINSNYRKLSRWLAAWIGKRNGSIFRLSLQSEELPASAIVLEVGTAFLDALSDIEEASRVIIIDAMKAGHSPGTVYRVPAGKCVKPQCIASLHGFDLSRVLFLAGKTSSPEAVVFGVEPSRIDWGIELSPEIQNIIPTIVEAVKTEIRKPRFPSGIE